MLKELAQKITGAMERLVTLEIVTAVGTVGPRTANDKNWPDLAAVENPQMIVSKINLLDGDIQTIFGEPFITGPYTSLVDFHSEREKQGYKLVQDNIATLKALVELARDLDKDTSLNRA